jgi:peptidyl-prolyl cis-trans isomerase SurA
LLKKITFALVFCGAVAALATASLGAQLATTGQTKNQPQGAPPANATASLRQPANELPGNGPSAEDANVRTVGIAAVVNDGIITDYELRQRLALLGATTGVRADNDEQKKALRSQVLRQLETEKMQVQEANRKNITINSEEVDKAIENILKENGLTIEKLTELLSHNGVNIATLRTQIAVQLGWQRAVEDEYGDQVHLKPSDVDSEYAHVKAGANKVHYQVAEIFLGVDNPEQDEKVKKDADQVHEQLDHGAPFNSLARQFSQSPSAASGGDLGFVEDGQLPPDLNAALGKMKVGEITQPIRSVGGYYILFLRRRFEPTGTKIVADTRPSMPTNATPLAQVLIPIGPKPPKALMEQALGGAQQIAQHVESCSNLKGLVGRMRGVIYQDLSAIGVHMNDLDPQIQEALKKTEPGESSVPFVNQAGVNLIVRCDAKRPPPPEIWPTPSREEVENQLMQERISTLARGYLARLRRGADVQTR